MGIVLRYDPFEIVFARQPEKRLAITLHVVAVEEPFRLFRHHPTKALLAVAQRQITSVLAVAEPTHLFLIIRLRVLVPENVESVKDRFGTAEQQVTELRLAMRIEADNLAIEHTPAALEVTSQSFAQSGKAFERVPVARYQPDAIAVGIKERTKAVPLDLEKPIGIVERLGPAAERHGLEHHLWKR